MIYHFLVKFHVNTTHMYEIRKIVRDCFELIETPTETRIANREKL